MKTSLTKLSSSLFLLLLANSVWSKPVAQVTAITGTVFMINAEGKTSSLKVDQHIEEKSEVMVEEGASITVMDYFNSTYQLVGGSHLKLFNKSVQLKRGKTWIQAKSAKQTLALTTANGYVDFSKGEFITTFDQNTSKTQVLVVNGDIEVSNILERNMKQSVSGGSFTMIDPDVENGSPRAPTKVGLNSLNSALAEFNSLPVKTQEAVAPARGIASVSETAISPKRGEIIFIKTTVRNPASVSAHKYYSKKTTKGKNTHSAAPIKVYGGSWSRYEEAPRKPASVPMTKAVFVAPSKVSDTESDQEFGSSLKTHSAEQPKYPKDLDNLVKELSSF